MPLKGGASAPDALVRPSFRSRWRDDIFVPKTDDWLMTTDE